MEATLHLLNKKEPSRISRVLKTVLPSFKKDGLPYEAAFYAAKYGAGDPAFAHGYGGHGWIPNSAIY